LKSVHTTIFITMTIFLTLFTRHGQIQQTKKYYGKH